MGIGLPPFASNLATRLFEKGGAKALSESEKAAKLATRLEELGAKSSLSAAERTEQAELKKAVGEMKDAGWKPKEGAAPKDPNESSFSAGKKPHSATGVIDNIQNWVDGATLAGGVAGAALTVTALPVGAATTFVTDVVGLVNAGVDLVQAGAAAAQGDYAEAGKQLVEAGGRAFGSIPYLGIAMRTAKVAEKVGEKVVAEVAEKVVTDGAAKTTASAAGSAGSSAAGAAGTKAGAAAGTKAAGMSEEAVSAFVKETAEHPAFADLGYSLGKQFKGAKLTTIADPQATKAVAEAAAKIQKGETAGTTLSRYQKGDAGVNDFLRDVAAKFEKAPGAKLTGEAVAAMGGETAKVLGKAAAPLTESAGAALKSGKLATKDLDTLRKAGQLIQDTNNPIVRDGMMNAMKVALESGSPGKALAQVVEKGALIEKTFVKGESMALKLSQGSADSLAFRESFETLLTSDISFKGLDTALKKPELLAALGTKNGFTELVNEARRMNT